jgi:hypothetical protein
MILKTKIRLIVFIAIGLPCVYALCSWNSLRKIDNFCNSINTSTKISDLAAIALREGVDLDGPMAFSDTSGTQIYAIAASGFTVGEYACSIHGASMNGNVVRKRLGY